MNERQREVAFEGYRWFDLRRNDQKEIKHTYNDVERILQKNDPRYTIAFPKVLDKKIHFCNNFLRLNTQKETVSNIILKRFFIFKNILKSYFLKFTHHVQLNAWVLLLRHLNGKRTICQEHQLVIFISGKILLFHTQEILEFF